MAKMNKKEHRKRHGELHRCLDELDADWITHNTKKSLTNTSIIKLMEWSQTQTLLPDEKR